MRSLQNEMYVASEKYFSFEYFIFSNINKKLIRNRRKKINKYFAVFVADAVTVLIMKNILKLNSLKLLERKAISIIINI
jgi:hypothetical protein